MTGGRMDSQQVEEGRKGEQVSLWEWAWAWAGSG